MKGTAQYRKAERELWRLATKKINKHKTRMKIVAMGKAYRKEQT